eukprot:TRINITY_DN2431_c0_g2_i1.p1 TRINITY_DN2431_c0_g2~~TRINITY_DN2431_c0_g2_i1.p1  ORF type:complete len:219 (+),score=67.53 TRINITY_DN2431_c0_g2_i1:66-722(+)
MGAKCSCEPSKDDVAQPEKPDGDGKKPMVDAAVAIEKFKDLIKKKFKNPGDAFKGLDRDDDKGVTKKEFVEAMDNISQSWEKIDRAFMKRDGAVIFDELDLSGDGNVTFKEFKERLLHKIGGSDDKKKDDPLEKLKTVLKKSFKDPKEAFSALDKDGDTSLSREEFKTMLLSSGTKCKWNNDITSFMEENVNMIFDAMDGNEDGTVTLKEFKKKLGGK